MLADTRVPPHDVLLTNPPYSGDHMQRLLTFCRTHNKPWMLLLPSYTHQKPYFEEIFKGAAYQPFFALPKKRYHYWTPKGVARENPKVRKDGRTAPFVSLWCDFNSFSPLNPLKLAVVASPVSIK